uniref:NB-ARC domain-containing protein n=1 Tax=Nelumbo nucifera TaxID=4432 RepID=A0A822YFK5_NELNU|nr:TPA_asm: hypothetical protein HUJ06_031213 [Nelumbo nucifera]
MCHRIKRTIENLDAIASDMSRFHILERSHDTRPSAIVEREQTHSFVHTSDVIRRDQDKKNIVDLLLNSNLNLGGGDNREQEQVSIISIVGIGGLGKTTLAQLAYNDHSVVEHFKLRMWVCVSDDFDVKKLTKEIMKCIRANIDCSNQEMEQLQADLRKELDGKRYLLVLDDVWNEDLDKWVKLRGLLTGGSVGSKILVTTWSEKVASIMGTSNIRAYHLGGLSEDECWSLFKQWAFEQG